MAGKLVLLRRSCRERSMSPDRGAHVQLRWTHRTSQHDHSASFLSPQHPSCVWYPPSPPGCMQICFQMWDNGCSAADDPCCGSLRTLTHKFEVEVSEYNALPLLTWP